jgi:hypothetical protein
VDSLNRRFLPCYANDRVIAPNLERFSERSVCFGRHLVGPAPCMPARETALYGWFDSAVNVADRRYNYLRAAIPSTEPLDFYGCMAGNYDYYWPRSSFALIDACRFLPYTDMPVGRQPERRPTTPFVCETQLFHCDSDPLQAHNLAGSALESRLIELLKWVIRESDALPEQYDRLRLR